MDRPSSVGSSVRSSARDMLVAEDPARSGDRSGVEEEHGVSVADIARTTHGYRVADPFHGSGEEAR